MGLRVLAAMIILSISMGACTSQKQTDKEATPVLSGPPSTAFPMPPLNARTEMGWVLNDGQRATLADYRGRVLVLDFYATWCVPCRQSIPRLIALQKSYGPRGLQIVGLNVGGPDDRIKVADFARELGIEYPLGFPDKALTDLFLSGDQTIPQTFVFGRDGHLVKRFIGYEQASGAELEKVISEAVNSKQQTANGGSVWFDVLLCATSVTSVEKDWKDHQEAKGAPRAWSATGERYCRVRQAGASNAVTS